MNSRNNPLNIKWADPSDPSQKWQGSTGYDSRGHAIFIEPAMGIRAAMRSLQKKWQNGKRTIRAIIEDWAPASDTVGSIVGNEPNSPREYAHFVSVRTGYRPDEILPDPETITTPWARLIYSMAYFEMGEACPWIEITRGINFWHRDFCEGKK